ncbi:hypothetical protein IB276_18470 [Ensifer sp. ENS04]|uniref:hypothetical protein n=1 Tax=Ensifer sp. ENS04 TaxID=2769281 RepID=UPI00177E60A5|nr:hypothetical protein [Ensifer sp. ENS04]MBD9541442.1 hypothetical protein [Ensifer sp. ENS04]
MPTNNELLALVLASCISLSSCASLPKATKVENFGASVESGMAVLEKVVTTNRQLAFTVGEEDQANRYVTGKNFTLGDKPDRFFDPERINTRRQALQALGSYGAALKLAADGKTIQDLENASVRLGEAAGNIMSAASPVAAPIIGPATKVVARGVGFALGNAYATEIQSIITARDPDVKTVVQLLKDDLEIIAPALELQFDDLEVQRKLTLVNVRSDRRVDRLRLYAEYETARRELDTLKVQVAAANSYEGVLDAIVEAHSDLAKGEAEAAGSVARLVALTNDLSDLVAVIAKE